MTTLHLCTTNDTNGNPRRIFVELYPEGDIARWTDEGYEGPPSWARYPVRIDVAPAEYRRWLRRCKAACQDFRSH